MTEQTLCPYSGNYEKCEQQSYGPCKHKPYWFCQIYVVGTRIEEAERAKRAAEGKLTKKVNE
jgi:hypothetical protein